MKSRKKDFANGPVNFFIRIVLNGLVIYFAFLVNISYSETVEEKGLRIATAMERRDDGWIGQTADVEMLVNQQKDPVYKFHARWLEKPEDGDKGVLIYKYPSDMRGVISLAHLHRFMTNDMWIFIPRNKRVKRFSSQKKNSSFLGSQFTNEDLNRGEVEKYSYRWIRDEDCEGLLCSVVDRFPEESNSGYTKQRIWIDQKEQRVMKMEFYNLKNFHIKTLYFKEFKQYLKYFWRESKRIMVNEKTDASTIFLFKNWKLKVELNENDFVPTRLKKLR